VVAVAGAAEVVVVLAEAVAPGQRVAGERVPPAVARDPPVVAVLGRVAAYRAAAYRAAARWLRAGVQKTVALPAKCLSRRDGSTGAIRFLACEGQPRRGRKHPRPALIYSSYGRSCCASGCHLGDRACRPYDDQAPLASTCGHSGSVAVACPESH